MSDAERKAVEQVWRHRKTGDEMIVPYGAVVFSPVYSDAARVAEHRLARGNKGKGLMPQFTVEYTLWEGRQWVTLPQKFKTREAALNYASTNAIYRAMERVDNAYGSSYVPIVVERKTHVPVGTGLKPSSKPKRAFW